MKIVKPSIIIVLLFCLWGVNAFGATSVTQYGITWTFDGDYQTGNFANGDYWVVGPVVITSIRNTLHPNRPANAEYDGSMVNPMPGNANGFYRGVGSYNASLNVNNSLPLTLDPSQSLVSSVSWLTSDPGHPTQIESTGVPRPALRDVAILTCLSTSPPSGSFRPPYSGNDKPLHNLSQLRPGLLPSLEPVYNTPSLSSVERTIQRPWLDFFVTYVGRLIHPSENFPGGAYGHDVMGQSGTAALMLLLDENEIGNKTNLLTYFVQMGIDNYGVLANGGQWPSNGGHGQGRKLPILFAGLLLNDSSMLGIGSLSVNASNGRAYFQEDGDTYYTNTGTPDWGIRHSEDPSRDSPDYNASYRHLNRYSHHMLVALAMGLKDDWNHNAFFDYTDRYVNEIAPSAYPSEAHYNSFTEAMWVTYRDSIENIAGDPGSGGDTGVVQIPGSPPGARILQN